jgi:hypothetical protein
LPSEKEGEIVPGFDCLYFLTKSGRLFAAGSNSRGKLGLGSAEAVIDDFGEVTMKHRVKAVRAGMDFSLVLDGALMSDRPSFRYGVIRGRTVARYGSVDCDLWTKKQSTRRFKSLTVDNGSSTFHAVKDTPGCLTRVARAFTAAAKTSGAVAALPKKRGRHSTT